MRKRGRRVLLLHSYRDGQGRVCQARLGDFSEVEEARSCLSNPVWREDFARRFPRVKVDWARVLRQAEETPENPPRRSHSRSHSRSRSRSLELRLDEALSTFLRLWAQVEDAHLTQKIADVLRDRLRLAELDPTDLEALEWRTRARLEPRRSDFRDGTADVYLETLSRRAEQLKAQGRLQEACQVLEEVAQSKPTAEHQADYAAALQVLGRTEEAIAQYERMPRSSAVRYYNLASIYCRNGQMDQALGQLMSAMLRDSQVARAVKSMRAGQTPLRGQEYWQKFGDLWDPVGRWFLLGTYSQPLVRSRLTRAAENRQKPRELVKGKARELLLQRVLHWDPPRRQAVARRKRSSTASHSGL
ncbi:MAG: tetratricopeptide repeat protein [Candidatus Eremiobacteraeota bacterium]|nr:tetratricopeptide repeat protein [Candidatus Eremiobacteraeota bacterium]